MILKLYRQTGVALNSLSFLPMTKRIFQKLGCLGLAITLVVSGTAMAVPNGEATAAPNTLIPLNQIPRSRLAILQLVVNNLLAGVGTPNGLFLNYQFARDNVESIEKYAAMLADQPSET